LGSLIAIIIWYLGFAIIGGEYFSMWANKYNGQDKAYMFVSIILLSTIVVILKSE